jgi:hypothetical protein
MYNSEIEKTNISIALFMGFELAPINKKLRTFEIDGHFYLSKQLKFNSSWEWLMPVVEKINTLKAHNPDGKELSLMSTLTVNMVVCGYYREARCSIIGHITHCYTLTIPHSYKKVDLPSIFVHGKKTLIESVYEAVIKFIEWYETNKLPVK